MSDAPAFCLFSSGAFRAPWLLLQRALRTWLIFYGRLHGASPIAIFLGVPPVPCQISLGALWETRFFGVLPVLPGYPWVPVGRPVFFVLFA